MSRGRNPNEWQPQNIPVDIRADDPNAVAALIEQYRQLVHTVNDFEVRIQELEAQVLS